MIGGLVEHDGHRALAIHLGKADDNEAVAVRIHGLSAETIADAVAELKLMGLGCRTKKPLLHVWASPSQSYSTADWETYWAIFEAEYGLEGHPYLEVRHLKYGLGGRSAGHVHRVYLRVDAQGKAVRTNHSAARQEKISRIAEHMTGERFTSGCFNTAVIARLRQEGRADIAEAMVRAGLDQARATKAPSSTERAMTERLSDLAADEVWRRAVDAWRRSDNGASFRAALAESGLRIAMGEKCPVLVSPGGAIHPLLRAINKGGERQNGNAVRKSDLDTRLEGLVLPLAADLGPVPGFDAGAFGIVNLDRIPVAQMPIADAPDNQEAVAEPPASQMRPLMAQQEAALLELENAFHSTAAERAKAIREGIEADVHADISQRKLAEALRLRIDAEKDSWDLPGIGVPGWRDAYRADLAGLPRKYGAHLKWVDKLDAERRRVVLKSGTTVTLAPKRGWTDKTTGDAVAVMIAHARQQGWTSITITGNARWRHALAKAATRAGLAVADPDLLNVVKAENADMASERLLAAWWRSRNAFVNAPSKEGMKARTALIALLEQIQHHPEIFELIVDDDQRRLLDADLDAYEQYRVAWEQQVSSGPPRPG